MAGSGGVLNQRRSFPELHLPRRQSGTEKCKELEKPLVFADVKFFSASLDLRGEVRAWSCFADRNSKLDLRHYRESGKVYQLALVPPSPPASLNHGVSGDFLTRSLKQKGLYQSLLE
jgi:hypothetical protein